jgi:hypothetical protein
VLNLKPLLLHGSQNWFLTLFDQGEKQAHIQTHSSQYHVSCEKGGKTQKISAALSWIDAFAPSQPTRHLR